MRLFVCTICNASRGESQYSVDVKNGNTEPVCNPCKSKFPKNNYGRAKVEGPKKSELKMLPCLGKCGKSFLTIPEVRFCNPCKPTGANDNYKVNLEGEY